MKPVLLDPHPVSHTRLKNSPTLIRSLGLGDATMLVVGCIIGVGIFRTASSIATHLQNPWLILGLWLFGGLLSLCGALCYAELAALFPKSGGDYVYISKIYGRFWGFLFGWTKLFIERTGTIAILGVVFAEYLARILPQGPATLRGVATAAIVGLTAVNVAGVRWGKYVQNIFTSFKVVALVLLIGTGFWTLATHPIVSTPWMSPAMNLSVVPSMGMALIFVLWTYGGWTEAAYVAEEVKQPTRNVPIAIVGGVLFCTLLYVMVNASYLLLIPIERLPETPLVAASLMQQVFGETGSTLIVGLIACSAFGALNGYILTGARILYALGKDHTLFSRLGKIHPSFHTPERALWTNAAIAICLVWTKTFDQIMTYSTVVISIFFVLCVFGVIRLRHSQPSAPRPYKAWGYPLSPILFCLTLIGFIIDVCLKEPKECLFGFGLLVPGFFLYRYSERMRSTLQPAATHEVRSESII